MDGQKRQKLCFYGWSKKAETLFLGMGEEGWNSVFYG